MFLSPKNTHKIEAPCWKARGPHSVLGDERGRPVVMIVSDQNFPAVLFSKDRDPCLAIMRIEDGMLKDLGFAFLDLIKAGLRICIHFIRIRIQHFRLNTNPDPDPIRIWIGI
jgi:hypothetical protein